ncbi:hypothetical protein SAMN05216532_6495 [Streptomyces sp. 2231.1]|nr:hypothetical protein SAMN05216532_6495 [Streptomyces sp. 2231.1]
MLTVADSCKRFDGIASWFRQGGEIIHRRRRWVMLGRC